MPASEKARRRLVAAAIAAAVVVVCGGVAAVVISGCGAKPDYPAHLTFPPRTDRLVFRVPTSQPAGPGEPGKLDDELAGLDALGGKTFDPAAAPADQRKSLDAFLADTFGTPANPVLKHDAAGRLGLTPENLAEGGRLYRRHCLQCHGLSGDGRGPTGLWVYPHPRDFRRGSFKFVSTGDGGKPRRADLLRTLRDGLKGTAMPAFGLLPESERELMAGYVTYLSARGQVEFQTLLAVLGEGDVCDDVPGFARERLDVALRDWERAEALPQISDGLTPTDDAGKQAPEHLESVRRGFELFAAPGGTSCISCHEDFGRKATYRYDVWGTVVRPADLTSGVYKGGNAPAELYHRVRGGIQPSGMPAHATLTDRQAWDLVHFVRALPYPRELPPDVRAKVYP